MDGISGVGGVKDHKVIFGDFPHYNLLIQGTFSSFSSNSQKNLCHQRIVVCPNMVEHYLSHNLSTEVVKPSQNGDHDFDTT